MIPFECLECGKKCRKCACREPCYLAYRSNSNYVNCTGCGALHDRTAFTQAYRSGLLTGSEFCPDVREYCVLGVRTRD